MSLMVHTDLENLYDIVCSRNFVHKIFLVQDKTSIKKHDNGRHINFHRIYNYNDLYNIENITVPDNFTSMIESNLKSVDIEMETNHQVIKKTDTSFIVKYTSILKKPEYVYGILGNTKIILYVQFSQNKKDKSMTVVHFNKKLVNANEQDDDEVIIDADNSDVISNIYQQDTLQINSSIVSISETLLGYNLVHDFVIPFINNIFNTSFGILKDVYILRFIKYMSKKNIEIYKKKE